MGGPPRGDDVNPAPFDVPERDPNPPEPPWWQNPDDEGDDDE